MATLYVDEQGSNVYKRDRELIIVKEGVMLERVPIQQLDHVVLMGRGVQISTAMLIDLLERGIPLTITNQTGSRHYATLAPGVSRFAELRTRQLLLLNTPAPALELARAMITAKLHNQRTVLASSGWPSAPTAVVQIDAALSAVQTATSIETVRGYEGAAAAAYFGAWRVVLAQTWGFSGRAFYPPTDPVNALLSFGYTLALNDVLSAVQMTGLDPYLGTFHVPEAGRPALGLDLLEEFRPLVIDRLVLDMLQRDAISRSDFERPKERPEAVYLTKSGRALLIERYEGVLNSRVAVGREQTTWRRAILLQAQAVARVIRGEQAQYVGIQV